MLNQVVRHHIGAWHLKQCAGFAATGRVTNGLLRLELTAARPAHAENEAGLLLPKCYGFDGPPFAVQ